MVRFYNAQAVNVDFFSVELCPSLLPLSVKITVRIFHTELLIFRVRSTGFVMRVIC